MATANTNLEVVVPNRTLQVGAWVDDGTLPTDSDPNNVEVPAIGHAGSETVTDAKLVKIPTGRLSLSVNL